MSTDTALTQRPRPSRTRRALRRGHGSGAESRLVVGHEPAARREALEVPARPESGGACPGSDPFGAQPSSTPVLRQAIADAQDFDRLQELGRAVRATAVALYEVHAPPAQASTTFSVLVDSLTRRSIELAISELGPPPCPFTWFALGSHGRREPTPGSDVDSALAWEGEEGDEKARSYMRSLGSRVCRGLARCGFAPDQRGATAAQDLFVRPVSDWRRLIRESIREPRRDKGLIVISLLVDGRVAHDRGPIADLHGEFRAASERRGLLRLMLSLALGNKPPVRFRRGFKVETSAEHRGRLDIKHGGLLPVTSIARYASLAAGATSGRSTAERLRSADVAGTLDGKLARTLSDVFELFQSLRLEHQVGQIQRGIEPDDYVDPNDLSSARRRQLRDAFSEVRAVQKKLGRQLSGELAFA